MDKKLLEDMLGDLKAVRAEMHGDKGKRAIRHLRHQLDLVIQELEKALESDNKNSLTALSVLTLLGAVVSKIPGIVELIDRLTKK